MYCCYHLKSQLSKKRSEYLLRCYTSYIGFTLILLFFVTIAYNWRTGNGKYTILVTGHCIFTHHSAYNTSLISDIIVAANKILQIILFIAYLVYYYKFNLNVHAAQVSLSTQTSQKLFRIALAMGGNVGLSFFIYFPVPFNPEYLDIAIVGSATLFFIQQTVIMASFICTKKMYNLCKSYVLPRD